jgi:hypothetical protein
MPEWIIRLWNEQRSEQDTRALLEALLEVRPVSIRFDDRCSAADIVLLLTVYYIEWEKFALIKMFF